VLAQNFSARGHTFAIIEGAGGDALEVGLHGIGVHRLSARATHQSRPAQSLLAGKVPITPEVSTVDGHG
jgi:hypothetical protein